MYKHILIATDGSELARKAVDEGLALAKALGAGVIAVHVTPPWTSVPVGEVGGAFPPQNYDRMVADRAQEILAVVAMEAKAAGVPCETLHVAERLPAEGILQAAAQRHCDLIVMASHGRSGIARLLLGGEASAVVSKSPIPVLIYRSA
jgi:nucleotide-binding universal stress UspA family protein